MLVNLSPYESRVLWFIFRKTYGWKKKTDRIALSQFAKALFLDRRLVHRALKKLSSKKMIVIYKDDKNSISYGFQKNYELWKLSSKKMTVISRDDLLSSKKMMRVSSIEIPTKETNTKETNTKEKLVNSYELTVDGNSKKAELLSPIETIMVQWNEFAKEYELPEIKSIAKDSARYRTVKARLRDKDFDFGTLIEVIKNSPFLLGETKENFRVFFDWVIGPKNYQKIIEGNYLNREIKDSGIAKWFREMESKYGKVEAL